MPSVSLFPIIILILVPVVAACSIHKLTKIGVYEEFPPEIYLNYVNDSSVNIVDVRTTAEFEKSHIEGAVNVNYFAGHFTENLNRFNLDTTKTLLIYCETQHRSLMVARKIYRAGFKRIIDLDKGMSKWRRRNFPFVSDTLP